MGRKLKVASKTSLGDLLGIRIVESLRMEKPPKIFESNP